MQNTFQKTNKGTLSEGGRGNAMLRHRLRNQATRSRIQQRAVGKDVIIYTSRNLKSKAALRSTVCV